MRYREIVESADELETAVQAIADYIQHDQDCDFRSVEAVLKRHGYVELVRQTEFYRVLFHDLTPADKALPSFTAVAERYRRIDGMGMRQGRIEGFAASPEGIQTFSAGTLWHMDRSDHGPDDVPSEHQSIGLVYTVHADPSSIALSMLGLKRLLPKLPKGPAVRALYDSLHDIYQGHGGDDEVLLDTAKGVKIVGMNILNFQGE